jgi:hypothetical protein
LAVPLDRWCSRLQTDVVPTTRYAKSEEVNIAYQVFGDGSVDLVFVPGFKELAGRRTLYLLLVTLLYLLLYGPKSTATKQGQTCSH